MVRLSLNFIIGGDGNDNVDGKGGNDKIYGGSGNDNLKGGAGNDLISGGSGNDKLDGGAGKDTFQYLSKFLGLGELGAGEHDVLKVAKGDKISFSSEVWSQFKSGSALDGMSGKLMPHQIDETHNIGLVGKQIQIDINGDGHYSVSQDFSLDLVGQIKMLAIDAAGDGFLLK